MTKRARSGLTISSEDLRCLKLCIAGAWLYGSISRGRAHELARALGCRPGEIDDLKFAEERAAEKLADASKPQVGAWDDV